ncbi:MAG TPA: helix-turn-helix domain-containing protein [Longimicrobiales bacterium]|nr:helix-turn-helix domain-containing protein [Longimicrobiales bacterium]
MDQFIAAGGDPRDNSGPPRPPLSAGDQNWRLEFGARASAGAPGRSRPCRPRPDLGTIARRVISEHVPGASLDWLRSGDRLRALVAARRIVIARAVDAGHTRSQIARYLNISLTTVSDVAMTLREPRPL